MGKGTMMPRSTLEDGETVIRSGGGGPASVLGIQGGKVYLTNRSLFHEPIIGTITNRTPLDSIAECRKESVGFTLQLGLLSFLQKCIVIYTKTGVRIKYYVSNVDGWIVAINEARKNKA